MSAGIIVIIVVLVVVAASAYVLVRDRSERPAPLSTSVPPLDRQAREERRRALTQQEDELIDRRVELDARRGPLLGDDRLVDEFVELENRLRAGEIDETEFEREKIRLLGG